MSGLNYSVLQFGTLRPLPVALAHRLAATELDDPYIATLKRLYKSLSSHERSLCLAEFARCPS